MIFLERRAQLRSECIPADLPDKARLCTETRGGNRYVGRSEFEAPETDGNIYFGSEEPCTVGEFVNVRITGAKAYDLMGERV